MEDLGIFKPSWLPLRWFVEYSLETFPLQFIFGLGLQSAICCTLMPMYPMTRLRNPCAAISLLQVHRVMKILDRKMKSIGRARRKNVEARAAGLIPEEMTLQPEV